MFLPLVVEKENTKKVCSFHVLRLRTWFWSEGLLLFLEVLRGLNCSPWTHKTLHICLLRDKELLTCSVWCWTCVLLWFFSKSSLRASLHRLLSYVWFSQPVLMFKSFSSTITLCSHQVLLSVQLVVRCDRFVWARGCANRLCVFIYTVCTLSSWLWTVSELVRF